MGHVVTVWWRRGRELRRVEFKAAHVRSYPVDGGWEIELCDKKWRTVRVLQYGAMDLVDIQVKRRKK